MLRRTLPIRIDYRQQLYKVFVRCICLQTTRSMKHGDRGCVILRVTSSSFSHCSDWSCASHNLLSVRNRRRRQCRPCLGPRFLARNKHCDRISVFQRQQKHCTCESVVMFFFVKYLRLCWRYQPKLAYLFTHSAFLNVPFVIKFTNY